MKRLATILLMVFCAALALAQKTTIDATKLLKPSTALNWPRTNSGGTAVEWVSAATAQAALNYWTLSGSNVSRSTGYVSAPEFWLNGYSFARVAVVDAGGGFVGGYNVRLDPTGAFPVHDSNGGSSAYQFSGTTLSFFADGSQTAGTALPTAKLIINTTGGGVRMPAFTSNGYYLTHDGSGNLVSTAPVWSISGADAYRTTGHVGAPEFWLNNASFTRIGVGDSGGGWGAGYNFKFDPTGSYPVFDSDGTAAGIWYTGGGASFYAASYATSGTALPTPKLQLLPSGATVYGAFRLDNSATIGAYLKSSDVLGNTTWASTATAQSDLNYWTLSSGDVSRTTGNVIVGGQLRWNDSGGTYGLQAYTSSTIGYLTAQGTRNLQLRGYDYALLATNGDKNFSANSDGSVSLYSGLTADPSSLAAGKFWYNSTTDRYKGRGSASFSVAQVETDVRMPVVRDVVAAATNIPAAATQEAGFWRVPSQYNGWKVVAVAYSVRTAGSGSGTVDVQVKRTTTGGSSANFGGASFSAGDLQKDVSTSLTVATGDLMRLDIGGNSMSTVPQGLEFTLTLSPF